MFENLSSNKYREKMIKKRKKKEQKFVKLINKILNWDGMCKKFYGWMYIWYGSLYHLRFSLMIWNKIFSRVLYYSRGAM